MNVITVNASKSYPIHIGAGLLSSLGHLVRSVSKAAKVAVISDSNVWPAYGTKALESLNDAGFNDSVFYVIEAGEQSKSGQNFLQILEFLAENKITRTDCVIALGGGVVGDLTGFAAASFLRGIDFIQVPTSLLACVDSSVGGKTAIDLKAGKNLAGAFYQPKLVVCDMDVLSTLPEDVFRDGCAEVIKYGVLYDPELFDHLKANGLQFNREWVVSRCISLKRDVVAEDEFDRGARQMLNLGHTIGHGIESGSNFSVSHGKAVAIGMAIVSRAAAALRICSSQTAAEICEILERFGLPTKTDISLEDIYSAALSDKKRSANSVNLIVPERIGTCLIRPTPIEELKDFIEAGL